MNGRLLDLHVCVQGRPLPEYVHEGRTYVEGRSGSEYVIRLRNRSSARVEVVLTVDGLSVIDASEGSVAGIGYVLAPWQTTDIKGFLRNGDKAAAFLFGGSEGSYRGKLGRDLIHLGLIGAAVFEEKVPPFRRTVVVQKEYIPVPYPYPVQPRPYWQPYHPSSIIFGAVPETQTGPLVPGSISCSVAPPSEGILRSAQVQNLGTGYGREVDFSTTSTSFTRATENPVERHEIRYDDTDGLRQRGVDVGAIKPTPSSPSAFPADGVRGCPAPEGWVR